MSNGLIKRVATGAAAAGAAALLLTPMRGAVIGYLSKTPTGFVMKAGQWTASTVTGTVVTPGAGGALVANTVGNSLKKVAVMGAIGGGIGWGVGKVTGNGQEAYGPHTARLAEERNMTTQGLVR